MEKLMELQQKLKNKTTSEETQAKSFITKKNTLPTNIPNQAKPIFTTHSVPSHSPSHDADFFNFKPATKPT